MKKLVMFAGLVSSVALLAACGGGGDDKNGGGNSTPSSTNSGASAPAANPQPVAFSCPDTYKKISLAGGSTVKNANLTVVTDDNLAKVTVTTPPYAMGDVTLCLGKPNPAPAGVTADYVYELKTDGDYAHLLNPKITLMFTTPTTLASTPVIELAAPQAGSVNYIVAQGNTGSVNGTNVTVTAAALSAGFFVVRLPH